LVNWKDLDNRRSARNMTPKVMEAADAVTVDVRGVREP
jgi:hypothetical protein